ncbi:MAG TPA: phosphate ABC transporter substrate-binding protein [Gammaproteobacteria bacterium]|jgi:phosphate transport system substrate-binding protein|nr:PstS family phosphate ABC transporter substrate-binding protein [Gammaproteobacteria bacterium]MDP6733040.1 PstS family phosphate ABC transporter substrate-binding protein [Gammaproteobacteria bacterium]HAJ76788.1 phosphate ABC transporter substrate-binding protein [Gammaproteobacteria bacterium]|tara:strand:- start:7386 stop:8339 length:954 start_codon:yes stop_codon:yes gene_type:complete
MNIVTSAKQIAQTCTVMLLSLILTTCSGEDSSLQNGEAGLSGVVSLDGSSTVFPISEAVAEEFLAVEPRVRVTVGVSGTGGGFQKFLAGETDINDASRTIRESEIVEAKAQGIEYLQIPVAFDGLSVVANPNNDWVDYLTVEELRKIWQPGSTVDSWDDVRPEWPSEPIRLYGPGTDSGTFDYFTEVINGDSGASRPDYTASEDDNVLVRGISGGTNSLGFFGYAYYAANRDSLKLLPIDGGQGQVVPTPDTINNGSYSPLSRPIFIYLRKASAARPEVRSFVNFYLENAGMLANEAGYIELPQSQYAESISRLAAF